MQGTRDLIERADDRPEYGSMVGQFVSLAADFGDHIGDATTMPGWTVVNNSIAWIGPTNPFGVTASPAVEK